ncbi:gluconate 2-dehydrogenase subunit 3 family protein [Daejeonella sp.]|uniref:gluconate 2-dehydrogenase subunit 3 family protein n=1 Tax=Daejeonella sp. TaxID=2805397 RepID=UPI0030C22D25
MIAGFHQLIGTGISKFIFFSIPIHAIPGAKAADTGKYIKVIIKDCTSEENRIKFMDGWHHLQVLGKEKYHQDIANLSAKEKLDYVNGLDKYIPIGNDKDQSDLAISAFQKINQLTLKGYFTSEIGATRALRYDPIPGNFRSIIPYKKGDKVWAFIN